MKKALSKIGSLASSNNNSTNINNIPEESELGAGDPPIPPSLAAATTSSKRSFSIRQLSFKSASPPCSSESSSNVSFAVTLFTECQYR